MTNKPHDALVRRTLSRPEVAGSYLRSVLEPELAKQLDFATIELLPGTFVDPNLSERQTDLLYRVQLAGQDVLVYVLLEHQSRVDPLMAQRLFVYTGRVLDRWSANTPKPKQVPAVVPVVLYSGTDRWTAPTSLSGLYGLSDSVLGTTRASCPELHYRVDDLRRVTDEVLRQRQVEPLGTVALLLLRHGSSSDEAEWLEFLTSHGDVINTVKNLDDVLMCLSYIFTVGPVDPDTVLEVVAKSVKPEYQEVAVTAAEKFVARAERRGERRVLLRLLDARFGAVSPEAQARLEAASAADLELWAVRVLQADTIEDVFEANA